MKRIELFGVEGIGKTTFYNELVSQRIKKDTWMTTEEARAKLAYKHLIENKKAFKYYLAAISLKFNINKWMRSHICDDVLFSLQEKNLMDKNESYQNFLQVILKYGNTSEYSPQIRLIRVARLYHITLKLVYLDNYESSDVFLSEGDNFSIHGLLLPHWQNEIYEEMIKEIFINMPVPAGLVYCYLDLEETIRRIMNRKKNGIITLAHRDPDDYDAIVDNNHLIQIIQNQSDMAAMGVDILRKRGVKILEMDMGDTLKNNLERTLSFLDGFKGDKYSLE